MSRFLWCEAPVVSPLNANSTLADLFTTCMTFAVLPLMPMFLVTIALLSTSVPAYFYTNKSLNLWSSLTRLKLISSITTVVCSIVSLFIVLVFKTATFKEQQIYGLLNLLFCTLSLLTHCLSLKFGYVTNGILHLGWLLELLSLAPVNFYLFADVSTSLNAVNVILLLLGLAEISCSFTQVILFYWPDNDQQENGYQQLNEQPQCPFETSSTAQHAFQIDKAADIQKITSTYSGSNSSTWDLTWLLIKCSWTHQLKALLNTLVTIVARYLYYVLLSSILEFATGNYPNWLAIFPAVALVVNDLAKNLAIMQLNLHGNLAFYKIRTAMASLIFNKMLRLSPSAQTNTATGVIINYINVDVGHSKKFWAWINEFVYCPSTITISMILLNFQVGFHNMAYGLGILIFFQITSLLLTRWTARFTTVQMKHKDERLKLINDLLNGIKILKLYGWESSMQKIVGKIRQLEVMEIVKIELIRTFIRMSYDIAPFIVIFDYTAILVTFYGYAIVDGNHLTPKSAFVTIFLFDMIRYSIYRIPQLLANVVTTMISLRRVNKFLNEEEREERKLLPFNEGDEFVGSYLLFKDLHQTTKFQLKYQMRRFRGFHLQLT
ncbi:Multidrug resistance-associated protein 1 isoform X1 [Aphelenchoides bicaudatus]|nr:Multidrug resistance-associated protein 1 isoform X1 [Aphelenchoides bicaudatus]